MPIITRNIHFLTARLTYEYTINRHTIVNLIFDTADVL